MIDETFHTDRDVGEFIEGIREPSRERKRSGRGMRNQPEARSDRNAALLDAIGEIEAQLNALAGPSGLPLEQSVNEQTAPERRSRRLRMQERAERLKTDTEKSNYNSAFERIQAQLARVDRALEKQSGKAASATTRAKRPSAPTSRYQRDEQARALSDAPSRIGHQPAPSRPATSDVLAYGGLDDGMQKIMQRTQVLQEELSRSARTSMSAVEQSADHYKSALEKLANLESRDDSLQILRDDVTALRRLLERANLVGSTDQVLNEIATLSGRIEQLTGTISETRSEPDLLDAVHDIRALLDRPTSDPAMDAHFERILTKLDDLPTAHHDKDFDRLSAQMDHLRDILSSQNQPRQLTNISDQIGLLADRLGTLEGEMRDRTAQNTQPDYQHELNSRLGQLQGMMERLDPNDRLMRLEDQLANLADMLEKNGGSSDIQRPLEALARQVESIVGLIDQTDPGERFDMLAERIETLDQHLRTQRAQDQHEQNSTSRRFDQVEQTLARIDDMLAQRMGSSDLTSLESNLSRLADRMEASEQALRAVPEMLSNSSFEGTTNAFGQLEKQIADLADRLDNAGRISDDQQFFEMLTSRLDDLAQQFVQSQNRFDAVDRIGVDLRKLTDHGDFAPRNDAKMAEDAALKALQKIGPMSAGNGDDTFSVIVDGLKDDLHGLRKFAESSETSTQQSLGSVSTMLNTIVERLGTLEDQVRANERAKLKPVDLNAPKADIETPKVELDTGNHGNGPRGLSRLLRRGKQPQVPPQMAPEATAEPVRSARKHPAPEIYLSGKAVSPTEKNAPDGQRQARDKIEPTLASQAESRAEQKPQAKAAPTPQPRTARIVDGRKGPAPAPAGEESLSKADFIAAARRAAQAAARESEEAVRDQGKTGFLARFKGSKAATASNAKPTKPVSNKAKPDAQAKPDGMNRKERRAAIAEAARVSKQSARDAKASGQTEDEVNAATPEERGRSSLFAKIGGAASRHSRPLLMAAAAILLAITTIQLVKNPNSSLHGLFNASSTQGEILPAEEPMQEGPAAALPDMPTGVTGNQSSLTPPSGSLSPAMSHEEASRAIAFSQPSGVTGSLAGSNIEGAAPPRADVPEIDMTSTGSISQQKLPDPQSLLAQQNGIPATVSMPADDGALGAVASPSVQSAIEMNKLLAPGIADTPLMAAANSGDARAQFEVGRRLTIGDGMSVDLAQAAKWFEKAANQSMPQAQYSVANLYEKGNGVKQDLQVARLWYQRAAELGNVKSMHNLAVLHAEGGLGRTDFTQAAHWFLKAADHGLKDSQYNLAILFARGMGVKQDLLQSYKWFAIAARQGDKGATKKSEEVLKILQGPQQKAAKALVAAWVAKIAKPSANKLADMPAEWKMGTPGGNGAGITTAMVSKTQSMLAGLGYNAGPVDGQMGPRTRTAIRNFQEIAGLKVTGKIDQALIEALQQRAI